jgi:hypothetical protein
MKNNPLTAYWTIAALLFLSPFIVFAVISYLLFSPISPLLQEHKENLYRISRQYKATKEVDKADLDYILNATRVGFHFSVLFWISLIVLL